MAKAKVLVTDISGKGKRIFHHGDVVTEESFPEGKFQKLVSGKFIELIEDVPVNEPEESEESIDSTGEEVDENGGGESTEESEESEGFLPFNRGKKKRGKK